MYKPVEFNLKDFPKASGWEYFKEGLRPVLVRAKKDNKETAVMIGVYKGFGDCELAYLFLKDGQMPMWCTNREAYEPLRWLTKDESVIFHGRGE